MTSLAPGLRREVEYNHFSLNVLSVKGKCMQSDDTQTPSPKPILWMVIPCYNEEAVLPETSGTFLSELSGLISAEIVSDKSSILFVDDGRVIAHGPSLKDSQTTMLISGEYHCQEIEVIRMPFLRGLWKRVSTVTSPFLWIATGKTISRPYLK